MSYTLGFQQSNAEREKQLELISRYASDPMIREKVKRQMKHKQMVVQNEQQPFPKYSFETVEISCKRGTCERITTDPMDVPVDLTDPFRIEKS